MYENIGKKIKLLAMIFAGIEAGAAVIGGMALMADGYDEEVFFGFLIMVLGPVVAWVSSWLLYAFGELVEKACVIADNTKKDNVVRSQVQAQMDGQRIAQLENLRAQGLITEQEYKNAFLK